MAQVRAETWFILVAYAAWLHSNSVSLRFEFSFMNGSISSRYLDHFGRICCVLAFQIRFRYVFEFSFMNGSSFEPILGSFWSRMLRGCVPDWVSLRFEFSFMNGSSFELCSDHFGVAMLAVRQELESQVQQAR